MVALPATQTAIQVTGYGTPIKLGGKPSDSIIINNNVPVPSASSLSAYEVLVHVMAISVSPCDYKVLEGHATLVLSLKMPYIPGCDFAGVVIAVGSKVQRVKVGSEVIGACHLHGAWTQYIKVEETRLAVKPSNSSFAEAATLPAVGLTIHQALVKYAQLQKGQRVLVVSASGGTGSMGVQLAKALGASEIIATTSSKNVEYVKSLGADRVIAYDKQQWGEELVGAELDLILDCKGGRAAYDASLCVLKKGGKFVTIASDKQGRDLDDKLTVQTLIVHIAGVLTRKAFSFFGWPAYYHFIVDTTDGQGLQHVSKLVSQGEIKPTVQQVYALKDAGKMLDVIAEGHVRGKLALEFPL